MEYTPRMQKAYDNFLSGYNCCQSVVLAFSDLIGIDCDLALKLASSFGGGMGRMREVCGAVSGMFIVSGILFGYSVPNDQNAKSLHYALIRSLADQFKAENNTIICRELLANVPTSSGGEPEERTPEYYSRRPCPRFIAECAGILERELLKRQQNTD